MTAIEREQPADRLAYSVQEVAKALGISRDMVNDLLRTGRLGSIKVGRRRLISRKHLERLLESGADV